MTRRPSMSAAAVTRRERKALKREIERVSAIADERLPPEPLQTWWDPALLQKIAQLFTRLLVPRLVGEWSKAKAPPKPVERAEPQASPAERPSILRGYEAGGVPIGEDEDPGDCA